MDTTRDVRRAERYRRRHERRSAPQRLAWRGVIGTALILGGLAMLASRVGVLDIGPLWDYWPLIPIAVGLVGMLVSRPREWSGPFWMLAGGIYCAVSYWGIWGFSWTTAWPIFLVAAGIVMVLEIIFGRDGDEEAPEAAKSTDA